MYNGPQHHIPLLGTLGRGAPFLVIEKDQDITPDLIYTKGVPNTPSPDPTAFDHKHCSLTFVEIGLCRDFGCNDKP